MKNITTMVKRMYNELISDMKRFEDVMLNAAEELVDEFRMDAKKIYIIFWLAVITALLFMGIVGIVFGMPGFCIPMLVFLLFSFIYSFFLPVIDGENYDDIIFKR